MKFDAYMLLTIAALACLSSVPAGAQQTQAPSNQNGAKKMRDPNEIVCEKQEELGTRLSSKRICKTRAEWTEQRRLDRMEIERVQTQRGSCENC